MKAGKALNERKVEIRVQFKPPAAGIHHNSLNEMRNELVVRAAGGLLCRPTAAQLLWAMLRCCTLVSASCTPRTWRLWFAEQHTWCLACRVILGTRCVYSLTRQST